MPGGGELRAFFTGAREDMARAVENAAGKAAEFGEQTAQKVRDSVGALQNAEDTATHAANGIRGYGARNLRGSESPPDGSTSRIASMLDGEDAAEGGPGATPRGSEPTPSPGDLPRTEWPEPKEQYPEDYIPSTDPPPHVDGPHDQPENWVDELNAPKYAPGRDNNCAECSRSLDNTWHGQPAKPAAMADPDSGGEPLHRMGEWAGQMPVASSMSDVRQQLEELGPGSSAVVGCDWKTGGGHWFNAVNDGGTIKAVDGQSGAVEGWPPSQSGLHFDESMMAHSDAIFFGADGKVVKP